MRPDETPWAFPQFSKVSLFTVDEIYGGWGIGHGSGRISRLPLQAPHRAGPVGGHGLTRRPTPNG